MTLDDIRDRLSASPPDLAEEIGETRRAAVAVVLRPDLDLLLIQRAQRAGDPWSGHMAFPGGRAEPGDGTLVETAMRETAEEVGLDLSGARLLGQLTDNVSPALLKPPRLIISAYVFGLPGAAPHPPLRLSPDEVAAARWLNLRRFLRREGRGTMPFEWQGQALTLPAVWLEESHIWGLTLRFLDDLTARLR